MIQVVTNTFNRLIIQLRAALISRINILYQKERTFASPWELQRRGSQNSDTSSSATSLYEVRPFAFTFSHTFMEKCLRPLPPFSDLRRLLEIKNNHFFIQKHDPAGTYYGKRYHCQHISMYISCYNVTRASYNTTEQVTLCSLCCVCLLHH